MSSHAKNEALEKGRITARVPLNVQETLQKAAELSGVPLNAFVVQAAYQQAQELVDRHEIKTISLSPTDAEWFLEQLARPRAPNSKLKRALAKYEATINEEPPGNTSTFIAPS